MRTNHWIKAQACGNSNCVEVWRHASASGNGACVEMGEDGTAVRVRDSKDPDGPQLAFTRVEWAAFLDGAKAGEFDL